MRKLTLVLIGLMVGCGWSGYAGSMHLSKEIAMSCTKKENGDSERQEQKNGGGTCGYNCNKDARSTKARQESGKGMGVNSNSVQIQKKSAAQKVMQGN